MKKESWIFDWNNEGFPKFNKNIQFDDETLRDGLQSPSISQPTIEQKLEMLHLMDNLGIDIADIGLPGAGKAVEKDVKRLAQEIVDTKMKIRAACAGRTVINDIKPIVEISQQVGMPIEVHAFIGSSPIRQYVENWDIDLMLKHTREAMKFSTSNGCPAMYVTEDTARTDPETLKILLNAAIESGATRLCLCDTVGHATPNGVRALVNFVKENIVKPSGKDIKLDWHGHSDRGLSLINTLAAVEAGVDRVHGTGLGIGERVGNAPMDLTLVNLKLLGVIDKNLSKIKEYCTAVSKYCGYPIPNNYPVVGQDAFRTSTGVHAAAIVKSIAKEEDVALRNLVYSAVAAGDYGFKQLIEIGPMSGKSNVEYWLMEKGLEPHSSLVDAIFQTAKESKKVLTDNEIYKVIVENFITKNLSRGGNDGSH